MKMVFLIRQGCNGNKVRNIKKGLEQFKVLLHAQSISHSERFIYDYFRLKHNLQENTIIVTLF
jgi:hypothetical protein